MQILIDADTFETNGAIGMALELSTGCNRLSVVAADVNNYLTNGAREVYVRGTKWI